MANKIAVIGHGTIGRHAVSVAPRYGFEVAFSVTRKGIFRPDGAPIQEFRGDEAAYAVTELVSDACRKAGVQCALLAIPSGGTGQPETWYITKLLDRGIRVVTAGKSALANMFDELAPHLPRIGFDATVGGGTMIPSFLREHLYADAGHPFIATFVMNGTLNYAQTRVRDGVDAEQICDEAIRLGFAEPPEKGKRLTPLEMYRGELWDVSRKLAIVCNTRLRPLVGRTVGQKDFAPSDFTEADLAKVKAGNSCFRYLARVCVSPQDLDFFEDIKIGGQIRTRIGSVSIAAGFVKVEGALLNWVPNHVGNAVHLVQNGDTDIKIGQGAGPVPTVGAMMSNLRHFMQ